MRRVRIVRDDLGLLCSRIDEVRLVGRVDGAECNAVDSAGEQVLDHPLLVADALGWHEGLCVDLEVARGGFDACCGDGPKGGHPVCHKGDFLCFFRTCGRGCAAFGGGGLVAGAETQGEQAEEGCVPDGGV